MQEYNQVVNKRVRDKLHVLEDDLGIGEPAGWKMLPLDNYPAFVEEHENAINDNTIQEADDGFTPDSYEDMYLGMELALPHSSGGEPQFAKVTKWLKDADSLPIGTAHDNPILDTQQYEVEFVDGHKQAMLANTIAENIFAQVDDEGNQNLLLHEIIDHQKGFGAVAQQDAFVISRNGTRRRQETTKGWELLVEWKDGSTNWVVLKDM
jgi:hypothetical protein